MPLVPDTDPEGRWVLVAALDVAVSGMHWQGPDNSVAYKSLVQRSPS